MGFNFTPTENKEVKAPFFEDARADFAPYYGVQGWTVSKAKSAVTAEIGKLGGAVTAFHEGYFGENPKRHGYMIEFVLNGAPGRIQVAGLPIRKMTDVKLDKVRVQALLNVRDWLKTAVTSMIFSPGNNPLIPHLLGKGGKTLAEFIAEQADMTVPLLLGEIVEN